jgi:hypothetical protein
MEVGQFGGQEPTYGQVQDFKASLVGGSTSKSKRGRPRKESKQVNNVKDTAISGVGEKEMNEQEIQEQEAQDLSQGQSQEGGTLKIQRTVFDLSTFDNVLLYKFVPAPARPKDIKQALDLVGGRTERLMELIYDGLVADLRKSEYLKIEGFRLPNEETKDGSGGPEYTGSFADDTKKDLINAAVLNFAKILGYDKDLSPEKKDSIKEQARDLIRKNPEMVRSIQESK